MCFGAKNEMKLEEVATVESITLSNCKRCISGFFCQDEFMIASYPPKEISQL